MQVSSGNFAMVARRLRPLIVAGGSERSPTSRGRNAMADSPQDLDGGFAPLVRSVQHLSLQTSEMTFGQPSSPVTLRSPGKRQ